MIKAAAEHPEDLAAIVALSAVREIDTYVDILPAARKVTTPTLNIGSRSDSFTDVAGARQPHELTDAMHGSPSDLVLIAGSAHGYDFIDPPTQATSNTTVTFCTTSSRNEPGGRAAADPVRSPVLRLHGSAR